MAKIPQSSVRVESEKYVWSHGHAPRGTGRWGFIDPTNLKAREIDFEDVVWIDGTYTEAKAKAVAWFAGQGVRAIQVMP